MKRRGIVEGKSVCSGESTTLRCVSGSGVDLGCMAFVGIVIKATEVLAKGLLCKICTERVLGWICEVRCYANELQSRLFMKMKRLTENEHDNEANDKTKHGPKICFAQDHTHQLCKRVAERHKPKATKR